MSEKERVLKIDELKKALFRERTAQEYYALMAGISSHIESGRVMSALADGRSRRQKELGQDLRRLEGLGLVTA